MDAGRTRTRHDDGAASYGEFGVDPSPPRRALRAPRGVVRRGIAGAASVGGAMTPLTRKMVIPVGATVEFHCVSKRPAIWMKSDTNQVLSFGSEAFDQTIDLLKFGFYHHQRGVYTMVIRRAELHDGGEYRCGNILNITLVVTTSPQCSQMDQFRAGRI